MCRRGRSLNIARSDLFIVERPGFAVEPEVALKLIEIACARLQRTTAQPKVSCSFTFPAGPAKALLLLSDGDSVAVERKVAVAHNDLGNTPTGNCAFGKTTNGFALNAAEFNNSSVEAPEGIC